MNAERPENVKRGSETVQAVILAAGKGKRLHPITATRTKAMAPILGLPIVERVMEPMVANGIQDFILVTSPDDDEILAHFQDRSRLGVKVRLVPQPAPLGMGHALLQAAPYIQGDFILSACDNLVEAHQIQALLETWTSRSPEAILTTLRVGPEEIVRMGIVAVDGDRITRIVEKPTLEDAPSNIGSVPLYVFTHRLLTYLAEIKPSSRGEYELQDAIQNLIDQGGDVRAFALSDRKDLTHPDDLLEINLRFLAQIQPNTNVNLGTVAANTRLVSPFHIEAGVKIGANCTIGPNVYIETGATIGDEVRLENAVVLRHRTISDRVVGKDQVIW
jgi:dTDP-glucose pyrophosphorylase